jgi:hypothetical protein
MIQATVLADPIERRRGAGLRIGRAIDEPTDARMD